MTVTVTESFIDYIKSQPVVFELYGHYQPKLTTSPDHDDVTRRSLVTDCLYSCCLFVSCLSIMSMSAALAALVTAGLAVNIKTKLQFRPTIVSIVRGSRVVRAGLAIARLRVRIPPTAAVYQRQLSVPSLRGRLMSSSESWGVNGHTTRCTGPVSVVLRLRLVSG